MLSYPLPPLHLLSPLPHKKGNETSTWMLSFGCQNDYFYV